MALIRNNEALDSGKLNREVKRIWESKDVNLIYTTEDSDDSVNVKSGITVNVTSPQPVEEVADLLVKQMETMLKKASPKPLNSHIVLESIISPAMNLDTEPHSYFVAYYSGNTDTNPPDVKAWMVLRVSSPTGEKLNAL